ncbi:hypothetical protein GTA62_15050 [Roseobacter sp. HKCCD9010]|nr:MULTISPECIES: hypothetical protein [unclassified Roseobacter]NNV17022.1 hypothetical protein [Roseobacter sp. HKCCD8768]NNW11407.1 hypothetical protein [Roseobacter sp. HKCCD8484]NNW19929.1 hypothetical protein [Roseobacter sp. HKCCD7543]NNW41235.1 hypothetical protein [Roseobacter sp. HKCCD8654]NNW45616.1 hypothetical protein [Roseobacter sp. HKCCD8291]NNW58409.1 hypothetical protein [Roseobacter sp. HKCCD8629]NNX22182.1 hypothetical protein [Roseobacter sp. HKCCD8626]NNX69020.1 hypothe
MSKTRRSDETSNYYCEFGKNLPSDEDAARETVKQENANIRHVLAAH